jgi:phosphatidylserine decarboxylase
VSADPIRYVHRYSGRIETEAIYGEAWLRWAYETRAGHWALRTLATRPWFSRWYGRRMDQPASRARIRPFIEKYALDPSEFADPPESYQSFNEFFFRKLRPEARPTNADANTVTFPADGRHLGFVHLSTTDRFYLKGQRFDLGGFLENPELTGRFAGGAAVFSRLCPVDYHRFHFPAAGVASPPRLLDGPLWSVSPIALRRNLAYLWRNRRWRIGIETKSVGNVLMTPIGATNVGSAQFTFPAGQPVGKGDEAGYFRFGGSAVLTLFEPGRVTLADDLVSATNSGLELYARVGDAMARIT